MPMCQWQTFGSQFTPISPTEEAWLRVECDQTLRAPFQFDLGKYTNYSAHKWKYIELFPLHLSSTHFVCMYVSLKINLVSVIPPDLHSSLHYYVLRQFTIFHPSPEPFLFPRSLLDWTWPSLSSHTPIYPSYPSVPTSHSHPDSSVLLLLLLRFLSSPLWLRSLCPLESGQIQSPSHSHFSHSLSPAFYPLPYSHSLCLPSLNLSLPRLESEKHGSRLHPCESRGWSRILSLPPCLFVIFHCLSLHLLWPQQAAFLCSLSFFFLSLLLPLSFLGVQPPSSPLLTSRVKWVKMICN